MALNTPIAATGPRVEVLRESANTKTSIARVTVRPLARIAGPDLVSACWFAACLSSVRRSSSRNRETRSRQ